jgi:tripartite-type tricarboxylate transporter receptor subunit TctC
MRRSILILSALLPLLAAPGFAQESFPSKPIRLVIAGPAGNVADLFARYIATRMTVLLGQPVTVDNKAGGNGFVGATAVLHAPPDGYSIFVAGSAPMVKNLMFFKSMPYDPVKDFRWISGIFEGQSVLVVPGTSPYKTIGELIATAKKQPGRLNYGSYSANFRLSTEWLNQAAGMDTTPINYKGAQQVATDLIGGRLDFAMLDSVTAAPLVQGGQLRALAITGDKRHALLPQVPTLQEAGLPAYGRSSWTAMSVRTDTPPAIAWKLTATMMKILAEPAFRKFAEELGGALLPYDDKQMAAFHLSEIERYRQIAAAARIQPE